MTDRKKILIALTSHDRLGDTGRTTGFYVPEVAHPWRVFAAAGYEVDLVSVRGGTPPRDGLDPSDAAQAEFFSDDGMAAKLAETPTARQVDPDSYAAILYAGGHGTMWDFPEDGALAELARRVYEAGGVVAAVCHGPAGLVNLTLSDGSYLVAGKRVAAFTNDEESAVGLAETVPFLLQSALESRGAHHVGVGNFAENVVVDQRVVTGQNPASAVGVAEAVLKELAA